MARPRSVQPKTRAVAAKQKAAPKPPPKTPMKAMEPTNFVKKPVTPPSKTTCSGRMQKQSPGPKSPIRVHATIQYEVGRIIRTKFSHIDSDVLKEKRTRMAARCFKFCVPKCSGTPAAAGGYQ